MGFQIAIHDNQMQIVDYMNNDVPGMLHYRDDEFHEFLKEGAYTYKFTIDKFKDGVMQDRIKFIRDDAYISFIEEGDDYLCTIKKIDEDDFTISVEAISLNLELINETIQAYKAEKEYTFVEYLDNMNIFLNSKIELGMNELEDEVRMIEFNGEQTVLARILELVSRFDGECKFTTNLSDNGQVESIVLNVYRARTEDSLDYGVGKHRKDVRLYYGREVSGIKRTIDKTNLFNAIRLRDKDGKYMKLTHSHEVRNAEGKREVWAPRRSNTIYAPLSMIQYPSLTKRNQCDNWILREVKTDLTDTEEMYKFGLRTLMEYMYPKITYNVELGSYLTLRKFNLHIGDTIYMTDKNFLDGLIIRARVTEIIKSFSDPSKDRVVLSNSVRIKSELSTDILALQNRLIKEATPHIMTLATSNGVSFKDWKGDTTITPSLMQGKTDTTKLATFAYYKNGAFITTGKSFNINPKLLGTEESAVFTVRAIIGNDVVSSAEVTIFNVNDGKSPYVIHIESTNGNIFKNNNITTTMTARLWQGEEEIDKTGTDFVYIWKKTDAEGNPDVEWNEKHANTSMKSLYINNRDVFRKSVFTCDVTPLFN